MDLRATLNLPDADFTIPMKADLGKREPEIQAQWDAQQIYHRIQESRKDAPSFVLHDGPPYTNSPIHTGTAMNKILKDFVVKSRTLMGFRAPYVPGYDNHGLPIEQTVMRQFHERKETPDVVTLRKACREHAAKYIDVQNRQFKRLGVFGLWERPYATMDFKYEAEIIRVFRRLVEGGYVYKGLRPTLWSPTSRTALADTEIVYQDHVSKAIYVRFPLRESANGWSKGFDNLYTIIWTTTPWTIPANLAVAFHPNLEYVIVKSGDAHYVLLKDLHENVRDAIGATDWTVVAEFLGISFEHSKFKHPIFDRDSLAVMAEYVTTEDGTGVVHTAPGHGRDDFFTGVKYDLPILCPVDERGVLTEEAGEFAGVSYKDCDVVVVDRLREVGNLLAVSDYSHSYPHAERDGKPVIFRATEQWFVGIDHNSLRSEMLQRIQHKGLDELGDGRPGVSWLPANGFNRIEAMIRNRPDWCISRQRPWGVGIPILYGAQSGKPVMDVDVIDRIADTVAEHGSDIWFEKEASYFLPEGYRHPETGETEFRKETDVLDVWFDSGCTNLCVLEGNVEPRWKEAWPADLYLEGSDQHRGWFNSSLIIATAIHGEPPYKAVVTHGFVQDEKGQKMSKRLGNVLEPEDVCNRFGADIMRFWVASVDWMNDAPFGEELLKQFGESYRRIRNTIRFLLSNLYDYPTDGKLPSHDGSTFHWHAQIFESGASMAWGAEHGFLPLDQWVIEQTDLLVEQCLGAYGRYEFGEVITSVHNFCVNELSAFYLDAIKDRMYCDGAEWATRRSGQVACHHVLVALTKLIAPILPHTAEEVWERIPGKGSSEPESVHMAVLASPDRSRLQQIEGSELQTMVAELLQLRAAVFAEWETFKAEAGMKDSQDAIAVVGASAAIRQLADFFGDELPVLFKFSDVEIVDGAAGITFRPSEYSKCDRSRLRRADVTQVDYMGQPVMLTSRDRRAIL
jgi:isoleucyl-tRNA synthetase